MDVVGGKNKKGHVYGLGSLGKEFASTSSQRTGASPTPDYVQIISNLTQELSAKDTQIKTMQESLDETRTSLHQTQDLLQQFMLQMGFRPPPQQPTASAQQPSPSPQQPSSSDQQDQQPEEDE